MLHIFHICVLSVNVQSLCLNFIRKKCVLISSLQPSAQICACLIHCRIFYFISTKKWLQLVIFLTFGLLSFAVFSHHMSLSCEGAAKLLSTIFTFNKIFMFDFLVWHHLFVCAKVSITLVTFHCFLFLVPCESIATCENFITSITSKLVFSLVPL